ncbi:MAG: hypothetical protein V2I67_19595 [Thermoanaerobaculales bacterium]|nr:hypothetical protein [Thermoanaerobaculales bacterium]
MVPIETRVQGDADDTDSDGREDQWSEAVGKTPEDPTEPSHDWLFYMGLMAHQRRRIGTLLGVRGVLAGMTAGTGAGMVGGEAIPGLTLRP